MINPNLLVRNIAQALFCSLALSTQAQPSNNVPQADAGFPPADGRPNFDEFPAFGPGGFGPGGPGGMMPETKLVKQFDKDGDNRLNSAERKAAREFLSQQGTRRGPGGPGGWRGGPGFGGRGENQDPPRAGIKLSPADVKSFPNTPLYDATTLRTVFLEFENPDWEKELADFKNTDVEVPAKVTVDGKTYPDVGVGTSPRNGSIGTNSAHSRSNTSQSSPTT